MTPFMNKSVKGFLISAEISAFDMLSIQCYRFIYWIKIPKVV